MPRYDLPKASQIWSEADADKFNTVPFHLAALQLKHLPRWMTWNRTFGKRQWRQGEGDTLKGVVVEMSPVGRQQFYPNRINTVPNKDVHEISERTEEAYLYRHNYETPLINFRVPFEKFSKELIPKHSENLSRQIAVAGDQFERTMVFNWCPFVYIPGKAQSNAGDGFNGQDLVSAPSGIDDGTDADGKVTAWRVLAAAYANEGSGASMTYQNMLRLVQYALEDLDIPFFEGGVNAGPADNEAIKGKYLYIGSNEHWTGFRHDPYILANKSDQVSYINSFFKGSLGDQVVYRSEYLPLRMMDDGSFPEPEVAVLDGYNQNQTIKNQDYINAPWEWHFLVGGEAYESIKVGPPPSEFTRKGRTIEMKGGLQKFWGLDWSGFPRLIDNMLIKVGESGGHHILETNKYGEFVQIIADTVHGIIPLDRRRVIAVLHRRRKVATA